MMKPSGLQAYESASTPPHPMPTKRDPNDEQLLTTATALIDQRLYTEAQTLLYARIAQGLTIDNPTGLMLLGEIAGHLIDLGSEGHIEQAINDGLALLENNRKHLSGLVTSASLDYNLGNAKSALADLRTPHAFKTPTLADHDLLLAAKNHYWKAHKAHNQNDDFAHNLQTNLANALRKSGRITEALTAYDDIITHNPAFTMAHFHRALALLILEHHSGTTTAKLLNEVAAEYAITINAPDTTPAIRDVATQMHEHTTKRLKASGYSTEQLAHEVQETKRKATQHAAYRQFTLQHHLALSEHSLYCHCAGARRDDLMIATSGNPVTGDKIPRLELILNRLKAEFGTARLL
jgi:tetratricopeptide (TPR) repeat protein